MEVVVEGEGEDSGDADRSASSSAGKIISEDGERSAEHNGQNLVPEDPEELGTGSFHKIDKVIPHEIDLFFDNHSISHRVS